MPAISSSAPGKTILFGEHAVVYDRPAIAVPVNQVQAKAIVKADVRAAPGSVYVRAPAINLDSQLQDLPDNHPLARALFGVLHELNVEQAPACSLRITSTIPVASGLGSSAAVTVAVIRAFAEFLGQRLHANRVSALAFEVEKLHHGTPSGIDNTVISYACPVYFKRNRPVEILRVSKPFTLVIADSGVSSPTAVTVADVRTGWLADRDRYERIFDAIGELSRRAKGVIEAGRTEELGPLMDANHQRLCELGVSSQLLDRLVQSAISAGALGAKLSGGGRGGNLIALVSPNSAAQVAQALAGTGAVRTLVTQVGDRKAQ